MATHSLEQAKQLLEAARVIASHQAQIARLSGANFNVFRLLRMEEDEVRLHSRFIAELLDPKGSHGQGSAFLEMFLKEVECSRRIDADKARVEREHYIGRVEMSGADPTGGRIDVFITDDSRHISIENKIDHGEGDHQVERYCNHDPESNFVLYLTPDGRCANTEKSNYAPISYGTHIVLWLARCHRYCTDLPVLRESIKQYLVVVRELTGGDPLMRGTNEALMRLLRANIEAARHIHLHYKPTIYEAVKELARRIEEKSEGRLDSPDWKIDNTVRTVEDPNGRGIEIWSKAWPIQRELGHVKWQYYRGHLEYGFISDRGVRDQVKSYVGENVGDLRFRQKDQYWAFYKRMGFLRDLESDMDALKRLFDEEQQDTLANQVVCELIEFAKTCDQRFRESSS